MLWGIIVIFDVDYHSVCRLPIKYGQVLLEFELPYSKVVLCEVLITIVSPKPCQSPSQKIVRLREPVSEVAWLSIILDGSVGSVISIWSKGYTQLPTLLLILRCHPVHNCLNEVDVLLPKPSEIISIHHPIEYGGWVGLGNCQVVCGA